MSIAAQAIPGIRFDWLVEESFAPIPCWHPAVVQAIPVALRRWRKAPLSRRTRREWHEFRHRIEAADYDRVIDAQGLLKSAWLARMAHGELHGMDRHSAREGLAAMAYRHRYEIPRGEHAIERVRELFSRALEYSIHHTQPDYGIYTGDAGARERMLVFLHATSWPSKHWPEDYWREMIELAAQAGYGVWLPWGNEEERERAERLAQTHESARVPQRLDLNGIAALLSSAMGAVAVDTGLGHLAAAFSLPTVSLYGPTAEQLTGTRGRHQARIQADFACAPCLKRQCDYKGASAVSPACFEAVTPQRVWRALTERIEEREST